MPLLHSLHPQSIIMVDFFKLCDPQRLVKLFFMDVYCMKQWQLSHTIFQFHFFGSSLWRNVYNMKEFMHWFLTLSFFKPYLYGYVCIYQLFLCLCVFLSLFTSSNSNKVRRQRDELQRSSASASTIGGRPESAGLWCDVTENLRLHQRKLTWNTVSWRFGSDDFPLQIGDFQVPAVNFPGCTMRFMNTDYD